MSFDLSRGFDGAATLVVRNGLAVRQWEACLAAGRAPGEVTLSPRVLPETVWSVQLWAVFGGDALVLSRAQSSALWRTTVADSAEGASLIGCDGAADWAAAAHRVLRHWQVDPDDLRAGPTEPDFGAFLRWQRDYRERLRASGWLDEAELAAALPALDLAAQTVVLATSAEPTPAQRALQARLIERGTRVEHLPANATRAAARRVELPDASAELQAAAHWAEAKLSRSPAARLAVVVPDLTERALEVERAFGTLEPAVWHAAVSVASDPWIGAVLNAVELATPRASFMTLSRWLRSPLLAASDGEHAARSQLEARLRGRLAAQLPFAAAYHTAGLAAEIEQGASLARAALDRAFEAVRGLRAASPTRWAAAWQRAARALGWPPTAVGTPQVDAALVRWDAALDALGALTPVLGAVPAEHAFAELERIVASTPAVAPLPLAGVHVVAHIDDVGPMYDAAWVTGFTDRYWPQGARDHPLLPLWLQRRLELPWSSPQDARARSAASLEALYGRAAELVFSWPARLLDQPAEPSPAIRGLPRYELAARSPPRTPSAARARETVADPPPPLVGTALVGGVRALDRQARCPIRSFCEHRLGARPLERVPVGLPARLQGVTAHRALELLYTTHRSSTDIARLADSAEIERCADRALAATFGAARAALAAVHALERERLVPMLRELVAHDARRAPFTVAATEQQRTAELGPWTVRIRIDRLDALADGSIAVIDYKTGAGATTADWFKERLRDTQVPLYAVQARDAVSAAVIARLKDGAASYLGVWQAPGAFPGTSKKLPGDRTWIAQLAEWRRQIEALIAEYAAGDVRFFSNGDLDEARGAYAPLTRVIEQVALARGALQPW